MSSSTGKSSRSAFRAALAGLFILPLANAAFAQNASPQSAAPPGFTSREPIEINSDMLEVHQQENTATFTGNVIAVQGKTRLKADKMVVHYIPRKGDQPPGAAPAASAPPPPQPAAPGAAPAGDAARVQKIDVEGHVLLATPVETASGDRGIYDVPGQKITLIDNVVLTRGRNVLKGDIAVYDFATGKTVINSPFQEGKASHPNGRVRALFVPEKSGANSTGGTGKP